MTTSADAHSEEIAGKSIASLSTKDAKIGDISLNEVAGSSSSSSSRKKWSSKSRSRSPDRRRHDRDGRHRHRRSSRSPSPYSRHGRRRSRSRSKERSRREPPVKKEERKARSPSPQLTDAERDRRTVFVTQLASKLTIEELKEFLAPVGKVRDVRLICDRVTGRSKGFGYIEFYEEKSVPLAIGLTGTKLRGIPIIVQYTETEKNRLAEEAEAAARRGRMADQDFVRLFVSNIHPNVSEDSLKLLFEPLGELDSISLHRDAATKKSKGTATVQYTRHEDAQSALNALNGLDIAGQILRVAVAPEKMSSLTGAYSSLDDSDTLGMTLSAQSRTDLMMKLARDTDLISKAPFGQSQQPEPTQYVLLSNLYDPDTEAEVGWETDIAEDIKEECAKFGAVLHLAVAKNKAGEVFLKFDDVSSSQLAVAALNGRWFAGRQILAQFVFPALYQAKFGRV